MEFRREPIQVSEGYRTVVADRLKTSRVTYSGFFTSTGTFDIVKLGEPTQIGNTTPMWALNLLKFTDAYDGLRTTREGFLAVYHGRMTNAKRGKGAEGRPEFIHTIDPANARFVAEYRSFMTRVGESGWVFSNDAAWEHRFGGSEPMPNERFEEILLNAELGIKPPFFDEHTNYVKVEPGLEGRRIHVITFQGIDDSVAIDMETRQLVGKQSVPILSRKNWK